MVANLIKVRDYYRSLLPKNLGFVQYQQTDKAALATRREIKDVKDGEEIKKGDVQRLAGDQGLQTKLRTA